MHENKPAFHRKIIINDEAHFHLGGYVNKQNCRIWGSEILKMVIEKPLYPQRVTVWCSFWTEKIIGPYIIRHWREKFPGRVISWNGDYNWPPRSCDLTPQDSFLWGYVKDKVYADDPQSIQELKEKIRAVIDKWKCNGKFHEKSMVLQT